MSELSINVGNRIEFYPVESLLNMAAFNLATQLWSTSSILETIRSSFESTSLGILTKDDPYDPNFWSDTITEQMKDLVIGTGLPNVIIDLICSFIPISSAHLVKWLEEMDIFVFNLLLDKKYKAFRYMHKLHWSSNGSVNWIETAEAMLRCSDLSNFCKFRIMCSHCMVNRLNEMKQVDFRRLYFENVPFHKHPLQYYWNRYLNRNNLEYDELMKLTRRARNVQLCLLNDVVRLHPCTTKCKYEFYLKNCGLPNVHAALYFWTQLRESEKVNFIVMSGNNLWPNSEMLWGLMSTLKPDQLDESLDKALPSIVNFLLCELPFENRALSVALLSTPQQFEQIVEFMIEIYPSPRGRRLLLFSKLWRMASTTQRSHMFNSNTDWLYKLMCNPFFGEYLDDMIFVFTHEVDYEHIKTIIFGIDWTKLIFDIDWKRFNLKRLENESTSKFKIFVNRVLLPEDAEIIVERI